MWPTPESLATLPRREPPADGAVLEALVAAAPIPLPGAYLAWLGLSNGGEGPLDDPPHWFVLWPAEAVVERGAAYEVRPRLPFLLGIGTNGGRELIAFETRVGPPWPVVFVPLDELEANAIRPLAADFEAFVERACTARGDEDAPATWPG
jgi:hypothetical protein